MYRGLKKIQGQTRAILGYIRGMLSFSPRGSDVPKEPSQTILGSPIRPNRHAPALERTKMADRKELCTGKHTKIH